MSGDWWPGWPGFSVEGRVKASSEAQVRYLSSLLQIRVQEVNSLKLELEALKNHRRLETMQLDRTLQTLDDVTRAVYRKKLGVEALPPKKKSWWRRLWKKA